MAKEDVRVPVTCDCGHRFEVPIAGVELEGFEFSCPSCGMVHQFTDEQIKSFVAQVDAAQKALNEALMRAVRGKKGWTYRQGGS